MNSPMKKAEFSEFIEHLDTVEEAVNELKKGNMVILIDREDRENEGDLVVAAQYATPENINFMIKKRLKRCFLN